MNLELKTFGLALIAVFALGALGAPGASATAKEFFAEQNATLTAIDATGASVLHIPGVGTTACLTTTYTGTVGVEQTQVTISPHYTDCTVSGLSTHIQMNGCAYVFTFHTGTTSTGGGITHTHGPMHIECPEEKEITTTLTFFGFSVCTIHIPPQTPTSPTVDYSNQGAGTTRHVKMTYTISGITMTVTNEGLCEEGVHHDGELTSGLLLGAYKEGSAHTQSNHVGAWVQ